MIKIIVIFAVVVTTFNSCIATKIEKQESAFIVMKTDRFKYADMGFITDTSSNIKVEIYGAGQPLMSLDINGMNICMSTFQCMEKKEFNSQILNSSYPDTILENIFRAKPIFDKKSLVQTKAGFSQKLTKEGVYDISYRVNGKERVFRDRLNKILIKVREE